MVPAENAVGGRIGVSKASLLFKNLRASEKLVFAFTAIALGASVSFPLTARDRLAIWGMDLAAGAVVLLLSRHGVAERSPLLASLRDWFPCVLIPLAYRESGLFFTPDPSHRLDHLFIQWDNALLRNSIVAYGLSHWSTILTPYFEFAYMLTYPLVPLGLLSLIVARQRGCMKKPEGSTPELVVDHFWTASLLAMFTCYVVYPFFPLTPPRVLFPGLVDDSHSALRHLNLWLLHQNGDQASLFPSGHVAGVTAVALAVRAYLPRLGCVFIIGAVSIALATVVGRYHYAADALAGTLVGLMASLISRRILKA